MDSIGTRLKQRAQALANQTSEIEIVPDGFHIKPSTIPNAGQGLFAKRDIRAGEYFVEYTGRVLSFKETRLVKDRSYIKAASLDRHIDASDPLTSSAARYINDHPDPSRRNCKFTSKGCRVFVLASRDVQEGEEFFVEYGRGHWLYAEDLSTAQAFLSLELREGCGGVAATKDLEEGVFLCTFSSLHWKTRFGSGLGIAIRKESPSTPRANCKFQKNPLLRGTTFVQATRNISCGEELIMQNPSKSSEKEPSGRVGFYVTGFGKFCGVPENPTTHLIANLRPYERELGVLGSNVLETSTVGVSSGLEHAGKVVGALQARGNLVPDTVVYVHFGVHGGARKFQLERVARNLANFGVPDERGFQPRWAPVSSADGTLNAFRKTMLDLEGLRDALIARGHDVEISHDAGDFICNYAYYASLCDIDTSRWGHDESLFVHVPSFGVADASSQLSFACDLLKIISGEVLPSRNARNLHQDINQLYADSPS